MKAVDLICDDAAAATDAGMSELERAQTNRRQVSLELVQIPTNGERSH
jgi:hypothetical protein